MPSSAQANVADTGFVGQRDTVWPAEELAAALGRRQVKALEIEAGPVTYLGHPVKVDLIIQGEGRRVGVICDDIDARRLLSEPNLADSLGLDVVLCVSGIDVLLDPDAFAADVYRAVAAKSRVATSGRVAGTAVDGVKIVGRVGDKARGRRRARAA